MMVMVVMIIGKNAACVAMLFLLLMIMVQGVAFGNANKSGKDRVRGGRGPVDYGGGARLRGNACQDMLKLLLSSGTRCRHGTLHHPIKGGSQLGVDQIPHGKIR